jgi:hypothetical protein
MCPAGKQVKIFSRPDGPATYINKQNGGTISKIKNYTIFQVCVQIKNVKEKKIYKTEEEEEVEFNLAHIYLCTSII